MRIDQHLHGYADGHRLLGSSIDLPRQEKYVMLGLSDMSGRNMVPGFEEYLTGYPLAGTGFYAYARTWYAPEMERPGCVWTHTLLIREKDIGVIRNFGSLRRLFKRPSKEDRDGWEEYRTPLEYLEDDDESHVTPLEQNLACALWALYGSDLPVLHPAEDAKQLEDLLLALWSQQWPSLRFAFRFCTGAIGVRLSGSNPFDYQVIPTASIREARREIRACSVVERGSRMNPTDWPVWLLFASEDLCAGGTSFRSFTREFARGEFDGRNAFAPLAELFVIWEPFSRRRSLPSLLEAIGEHYPNASEGASLKQAVAGPGFALAKSLMPGTSECDILHALATTTRSAAFDMERLEIDRRTHSLWERDRKCAESLIASLVCADLNSVGEHVLLSLIKGMSIEDVIRNSDAIPGLVATAVRLNTKYAESPAIWNGSSEHQRGLLDAATATERMSADVQRTIVLAMLQAGSDAVAERAVRNFGAVAIDAVMTWFDDSGIATPWDLHEGWRRALSPETSALLDWLAGQKKVRESSAALIADLSDPHGSAVYGRGADLWLKVTADLESPTPSSVRIRLYTFLLALGFDDPAGRPDELVARTFDTVHSALADNRLGEDSWAWLEDQLPTLAIWRHWDRCERLRRGLAERFAKHEWPVKNFFRCAPNHHVLRELLKACNKAEGGSRLLKRIRAAVAEKQIQLDSDSREVVEWYV